MKYLITGIWLILSAASYGNNLQAEIQHLKTFIAQSPCTYNLNGDLHTAQQALEHIQKKYLYYKDSIYSAEDFIEKSASKSTISGKAYTVTCPAKAGKGQQTLTSQTWLLRALAEYRNKQ